MKTRWTKIEEDILIEQVTKSTGNLAKAFRVTAELTGRTNHACELHWYSAILKRKDAEICFVTIGRKSQYVNKKIITSTDFGNTQKTKVSLWNRIINYFKK